MLPNNRIRSEAVESSLKRSILLVIFVLLCFLRMLTVTPISSSAKAEIVLPFVSYCQYMSRGCDVTPTSRIPGSPLGPAAAPLQRAGTARGHGCFYAEPPD